MILKIISVLFVLSFVMALLFIIKIIKDLRKWKI
jgi:hypothetical protein